MQGIRLFSKFNEIFSVLLLLLLLLFYFIWFQWNEVTKFSYKKYIMKLRIRIWVCKAWCSWNELFVKITEHHCDDDERWDQVNFYSKYKTNFEWAFINLK